MTQVCAQRHKVATDGILFPSKSSDKVYKVTAFRPDQFPFCSCPAYIFQRSKIAKAEGVHQNTIPGTCKHLQSVMASACDWRQDTDEQYQFTETCPKCGGPLVEEGDYSIPDDPTHAVDDLRSLLADLNGEEAPAPLPKPEPWAIDYEYVVLRRVIVDALDEESATAAFDELVSQNSGADDLGDEIGRLHIGDVQHVRPMSAISAPKKPRKAAAKKAAAKDRTRQVDVTGLLQGAKR